jgi:hypothetical protein
MEEKGKIHPEMDLSLSQKRLETMNAGQLESFVSIFTVERRYV